MLNDGWLLQQSHYARQCYALDELQAGQKCMHPHLTHRNAGQCTKWAQAKHMSSSKGQGKMQMTVRKDWMLEQGALYHDKDLGRTGQGSIGLVLGAGNQLPVVCFDIMHMLIAEDSVVICKMNPVNEYLGPFIRCAILCFHLVQHLAALQLLLM